MVRSMSRHPLRLLPDDGPEAGDYDPPSLHAVPPKAQPVLHAIAEPCRCGPLVDHLCHALLTAKEVVTNCWRRWLLRTPTAS